MLNKRVAALAKKLGLRLLVTGKPEPTAEDIATAFADALEKKYNIANRGSFGGMRFSNVVEVTEFPEDATHVALAMKILDDRGYDTEPNDFSSELQRLMTVRMSPRDPNG